MLTFAVALKAKGTPVPEIAKKLTIKTGIYSDELAARIDTPRTSGPGASRCQARLGPGCFSGVSCSASLRWEGRLALAA